MKYAAIGEWSTIEEKPKNPACKHGKHDCPRCGTSRDTDRPHTTRGGKGVVAHLREKMKQKKSK